MEIEGVQALVAAAAARITRPVGTNLANQMLPSTVRWRIECYVYEFTPPRRPSVSAARICVAE